jgi:hypothetical protein
MRLVIAASSELDFATLETWQALLPKIFESMSNRIGRRRTAWQEGIDTDEGVQWLNAIQQPGNDAGFVWQAGCSVGEFEVASLQYGQSATICVSQGRYIACDCAIAESNDPPGVGSHTLDERQVVLIGDRAFHQHGVDIIRIFLEVSERAEHNVGESRQLEQPLIQVEK